MNRRPSEHAVLDRQRLEAMADRLADGAKRAFLREGTHRPCAYLEIDGVPFSFDISLGSDDEKGAVRAFLEMAVRGGADACALIFEAWSAGGSPLALARAITWRANGRSLADIPGRREVLVVDAASPAGRAVRQFVILRKGEAVRLKPVADDASGFSRLLTGLPWPRGVSRPATRSASRRSSGRTPEATTVSALSGS